MLEIAMLIIMVTTLVAMIVLYRRGRGGGGFAGGAQPEQGSLYVTGVSPVPDALGEQFVTITGTLSGPTVPERVVYGRFVWEVHRWPSIGDHFPVVYPSGKPDRWQILRPGDEGGVDLGK
ncbi:hypothetical protein ACWEKT_06355 [Nocardia takedensis]